MRESGERGALFLNQTTEADGRVVIGSGKHSNTAKSPVEKLRLFGCVTNVPIPIRKSVFSCLHYL